MRVCFIFIMSGFWHYYPENNYSVVNAKKSEYQNDKQYFKAAFSSNTICFSIDRNSS